MYPKRNKNKFGPRENNSPKKKRKKEKKRESPSANPTPKPNPAQTNRKRRRLFSNKSLAKEPNPQTHSPFYSQLKRDN